MLQGIWEPGKITIFTLWSGDIEIFTDMKPGNDYLNNIITEGMPVLPIDIIIDIANPSKTKLPSHCEITLYRLTK